MPTKPNQGDEEFDAEFNDMMKAETAFSAESGGRFRRVKVAAGESWTLRFLPVKLGPKGFPFARLAKHWINQKPYFCRRNTHESFGGDEAYDCPICSVVDRYREHANEEVANFARKAKADPQWFWYCVVREIEKNGHIETKPRNELVKAYEVSFYKTLANELLIKYQNGARRQPGSFCSLKAGADFVLSRGKKNQSLDKLEAGPIFEGVPAEKARAMIEAVMADAESQFKEPTFLKRSKLQELAEKLEDDIRAHASGGGRSRRAAKDEDDFEDEKPAARRRSRDVEDEDEPAPKAKRRAVDEDEDEPAPKAKRRAPVEDEDEDEPAPKARRKVEVEDEDEEPAPKAKRRAPVDEEEDEPAPKAKRRAPAEEEDEDSPPPARRKRPVDLEDDNPPVRKRPAQDDDDDSPPPARRKVAAVDEDEDDEIPMTHGKKKAAPVDEEGDEEDAPSPKKKGPPPGSNDQDDDDEDDVPEENDDPAPKAKKIAVDEDEDDEPPAVASSKSGAKAGGTKLGERIKSAVRNVNDRD